VGTLWVTASRALGGAGKPLGGFWEASGRPLGSLWEASGRLLGRLNSEHSELLRRPEMLRMFRIEVLLHKRTKILNILNTSGRRRSSECSEFPPRAHVQGGRSGGLNVGTLWVTASRALGGSGKLWEAQGGSGRPLGRLWEASGRPLGGLWEASGRLLGGLNSEHSELLRRPEMFRMFRIEVLLYKRT